MSSTSGYILLSAVLLFTGGTLWGLTSCWGVSNEVAFSPGLCYYSILITLSVPLLIYFFILNWLGMTFFKHN